MWSGAAPAPPRPLGRSATPIGSPAASRGHVPERPGAPGCGRRGMDPLAASDRGPGEPSSQKAPSAEVSATGWGTRAPASTGAGSRGARGLRRGRSPGKRRGRASARRAWPLTAVGAGARADPSPRLCVAGAGGKGHRGCSRADCGSECEERGVGCREPAPAAGGWVRWERRGNRFFFFNPEDLWPLLGMCR